MTRLVGPRHLNAVAHLEQAVKDCTHSPKLVTIRGGIGVGKTRVVQELYSRLAISDPYWPKEIQPQLGVQTRKSIYPERLLPAGDPGFIWIGVSAKRDRPGGPAAAVFSGELGRQLRHHAGHLIAQDLRRKGRISAGKTAAKVIGALIGVSALADALEYLGYASDAREMRRDLQAGRNPGRPSEIVLDERVDDQAVAAIQEVAKILERTNRSSKSPVPLIVIVDDAHDADATTLAAVKALLERSAGVTVIATAWPSAEGSSEPWAALEAAVGETVASSIALAPSDTSDLATMALERLPAATGAAPGHVGAQAWAVAEHAGHNPLHLSILLDLVERNGVVLGAMTDRQLDWLGQLPREFSAILTMHWSTYLNAPLHGLLWALSLFRAPAHPEVLLRAAAMLPGEAQAAAEIDHMLEALEITGWAVRDTTAAPFGGEYLWRFSDNAYAEVAQATTVDLMDSTREQMIIEAIAVVCDEIADNRGIAATLRAGQVRAALDLAQAGDGGEFGRECVPLLLMHQAVSERANAPDRAGQIAVEAIRVAMDVSIDDGTFSALVQNACMLVGDDDGLLICDLVGPAALALRSRIRIRREQFEMAIDDALQAAERAALLSERMIIPDKPLTSENLVSPFGWLAEQLCLAMSLAQDAAQLPRFEQLIRDLIARDKPAAAHDFAVEAARCELLPDEFAQELRALRVLGDEGFPNEEPLPDDPRKLVEDALAAGFAAEKQGDRDEALRAVALIELPAASHAQLELLAMLAARLVNGQGRITAPECAWALLAQIRAQKGNPAGALEAARRRVAAARQRFSAEDDSVSQAERALVRALIASGATGEACEAAADLAGRADRGGTVRSRRYAYFAFADALAADGRTGEAEAEYRKALNIDGHAASLSERAEARSEGRAATIALARILLDEGRIADMPDIPTKLDALMERDAIYAIRQLVAHLNDPPSFEAELSYRLDLDLSAVEAGADAARAAATAAALEELEDVVRGGHELARLDLGTLCGRLRTTGRAASAYELVDYAARLATSAMRGDGHGYPPAFLDTLCEELDHTGEADRASALIRASALMLERLAWEANGDALIAGSTDQETYNPGRALLEDALGCWRTWARRSGATPGVVLNTSDRWEDRLGAEHSLVEQLRDVSRSIPGGA